MESDLTDRRIMWVPAEAHAQIERHQAGPGSTLEITKQKSGRQVLWTVVAIEDEPAARPAPAPIKPAANASTRTQQRPIPETTGEPFTTTMYSALCAAVRDAAECEKFAASIGRPLAFETSDIRAIAATLFIHATGGSK